MGLDSILRWRKRSFLAETLRGRTNSCEPAMVMADDGTNEMDSDDVLAWQAIVGIQLWIPKRATPIKSFDADIA